LQQFFTNDRHDIAGRYQVEKLIPKSLAFPVSGGSCAIRMEFSYHSKNATLGKIQTRFKKIPARLLTAPRLCDVPAVARDREWRQYCSKLKAINERFRSADY
jgi:hypothetical protein